MSKWFNTVKSAIDFAENLSECSLVELREVVDQLRDECLKMDRASDAFPRFFLFHTILDIEEYLANYHGRKAMYEQ